LSRGPGCKYRSQFASAQLRLCGPVRSCLRRVLYHLTIVSALGSRATSISYLSQTFRRMVKVMIWRGMFGQTLVWLHQLHPPNRRRKAVPPWQSQRHALKAVSYHTLVWFDVCRMQTLSRLVMTDGSYHRLSPTRHISRHRPSMPRQSSLHPLFCCGT